MTHTGRVVRLNNAGRLFKDFGRSLCFEHGEEFAVFLSYVLLEQLAELFQIVREHGLIQFGQLLNGSFHHAMVGDKILNKRTRFRHMLLNEREENRLFDFKMMAQLLLEKRNDVSGLKPVVGGPKS